MNNKMIKWNDQPGSRNREAGLLIRTPDGECYWFVGGSDENVRVVSAIFKKDGKWSNSAYTLELADGVEAIPVMRGFETGKWREGFCNALGLPSDAQWESIARRLSLEIGKMIQDGKVIIRRGPTPTQNETD